MACFTLSGSGRRKIRSAGERSPDPPQHGGDPRADHRAGRPPVHPAVSEAGRLLCAGTYLDAAYRDRVIDELFVHEERIAAPSYGFDAARVLAHALRARRVELAWAGAVLGAWFVGSLLTSGLLALLLFPCLMLSLARWLRARTNVLLRFLGVVVRIYAWWSFAVILVGVWVALYGPLDGFASFFFPGLGDLVGPGGSGGYDSGFGGDPYAYGHEDSGPPAVVWLSPVVFAAVVAVVGLQRGHAARIVATELSPARYADQAQDPAESSPSPRYARVRDRIRAEQHAPIVLYDINSPFTGAGEPFRPWQLSVELRPREDLGPGREPHPLTNAHIVKCVVPLLEALRVPSPHGSPQAEAAVLDRLRELVVDECVFLPAAWPAAPGRGPADRRGLRRTPARLDRGGRGTAQALPADPGRRLGREPRRQRLRTGPHPGPHADAGGGPARAAARTHLLPAGRRGRPPAPAQQLVRQGRRGARRHPALLHGRRRHPGPGCRQLGADRHAAATAGRARRGRGCRCGNSPPRTKAPSSTSWTSTVI